MRRYFVLTGLLLVMISKPARAQPGVVINLQNQSFGGDVTEDANFVYIETSTGKIKLDRLNVKKIVYAQPGDPTPVAPDSKTAGTPAVESPRSPEDLFKARGLVRSGFILILLCNCTPPRRRWRRRWRRFANLIRRSKRSTAI
jgi:hypothetical protein